MSISSSSLRSPREQHRRRNHDVATTLEPPLPALLPLFVVTIHLHRSGVRCVCASVDHSIIAERIQYTATPYKPQKAERSSCTEASSSREKTRVSAGERGCILLIRTRRVPYQYQKNDTGLDPQERAYIASSFFLQSQNKNENMTRQGESDTLNGSEGRSSLFDRSGCHSESTIQQQNTKRRGDSDSANESSLVSRPGMWNSSQSKPATTTDTISTQPTLPTNSTNTASLRTAIESETDAAHFPADRERTPVQRDGRKLNSRSSFGAHSVLYQGKLHAFIKKKDLSGCHQMRLCNLFLSEQNMDDKDESLHEIFDEIICCMTKKGHQWPLWKDRNGNIWLGDDPGELFDDFKQQDMSVEERREVLASTNPAMEPPPMLDTPVPTPVASVAAESAHPSIPLVVIEGVSTCLVE